jgi:hypothetical protein
MQDCPEAACRKYHPQFRIDSFLHQAGPGIKLLNISQLRAVEHPGMVIAHSILARAVYRSEFSCALSKGYVKRQSPDSRLKRVLHLLISGSIALFSVASLMLCVFAGEAHCADVTVAWDANPEPAFRGYVIYYGTSPGNYTQSIDVGDSTSCVISGIQAGATYYMAVTAYDDSRNESGFSNEIVYAAPPESGPASSSSGSRCFIATAAFGSPMAPEVVLLRAFRDSYLLTNGPGRIFVEFYYWISPPIADFISRDEHLKQITRIALTPVIYCVKNMTAAIALICLPLILWIYRKVDWKTRLISVHRKGISGRRV